MSEITRPSWDEYFMTVARMASLRSKDPSTKVGAVIVKDNRLISMGYNGMPHGIDFTYDSREGLDSKYLYVCHAELNALLNLRGYNSVEGSTIYVTLFPCNECAKMIVQAGIKKVIYLSDKYADQDIYKASRRLLESAGVELVEYSGRSPKVFFSI